jgi:hypothetical protein
MVIARLRLPGCSRRVRSQGPGELAREDEDDSSPRPGAPGWVATHAMDDTIKQRIERASERAAKAAERTARAHEAAADAHERHAEVAEVIGQNLTDAHRAREQAQRTRAAARQDRDIGPRG